MAKKKMMRIFNYKCSLTGKSYKTTKEAANPGDLVSVKGYYELNPDKDDRPEKYKILAASQEAMIEEETLSDENLEGSEEE